LHGDTFYVFTCASCSTDKHEHWERLQLNWTPLIQLVLYHLYCLNGRLPESFFHWKDEVCRLVDEHWADLIPHKQKTPAWTHSVSSTLSANPDVFLSGLLAKRTPGWWALARWAAPGAFRDKEKSTPVDDIEMSEEATRELRKEVLEKLLSVDTSLLEMAIKRARERKVLEKQQLKQQAKKRVRLKTDKASPPLAADAPVSAAPSPPEAEEAVVVNVMDETVRCPSPQPSFEFLKDFIYKPSRSSLSSTNRASPYETELLRRCNRVYPPVPAAIVRLRQKLLLKKMKRRLALPIFDLDAAIYAYLKVCDGESGLKPLLQTSLGACANAEHVAVSSEVEPRTISLNYDISETPYIKDPSLSLYVQLTGLAALYGGTPFPVTSAYTGKQLPLYIARDCATKPPKLRLLEEIKRQRRHTDDSDEDEEVPDGDSDISSSIDYLHIRKEHVGQLNALLSDAFWPEIDVSEALEYPDYGVVACYGLSVIGCALITPEGYLTYFYVRPDWQGHGIGRTLLALALALPDSIATHKDITLHVSADNPAMLLYQQLGFKVEQFVVNFYEKYFPAEFDPSASRNAFFMRLLR